MHLFQAIDKIRQKVSRTKSAGGSDVRSTILTQIRKQKSFDYQYAEAIEKMIRSLVKKLDDETVISMWRETEIGMMNDAGDDVLVADGLRMDLEMELLEAMTNLAYDEAKDTGHS